MGLLEKYGLQAPFELDWTSEGWWIHDSSDEPKQVGAEQFQEILSAFSGLEDENTTLKGELRRLQIQVNLGDARQSDLERDLDTAKGLLRAVLEDAHPETAPIQTGPDNYDQEPTGNGVLSGDVLRRISNFVSRKLPQSSKALEVCFDATNLEQFGERLREIRPMLEALKATIQEHADQAVVDILRSAVLRAHEYINNWISYAGEGSNGSAQYEAWEAAYGLVEATGLGNGPKPDKGRALVRWLVQTTHINLDGSDGSVQETFALSYPAARSLKYTRDTFQAGQRTKVIPLFSKVDAGCNTPEDWSVAECFVGRQGGNGQEEHDNFLTNGMVSLGPVDTLEGVALAKILNGLKHGKGARGIELTGWASCSLAHNHWVQIAWPKWLPTSGLLKKGPFMLKLEFDDPALIKQFMRNIDGAIIVVRDGKADDLEA